MVKKILTRFAVAKKTAETGEAVYRSPRIYLPTKLTDDSVFPFKEGDLLVVRVDGRRLVVQRVPKSRQQGEVLENHTLERRIIAAKARSVGSS